MSSKIEWTDETWNVVTGCDPVSEGCKNCYARRMARRLAGRYGYPEAPHHFGVTLWPGRLEQPLRWKKPRRVFVVSMGDLFHEDVPFEFIEQVYGIMAEAKHHTFQVLTKRPKRAAEFLLNCILPSPRYLNVADVPLIWKNVWLGTSIENQAAADERIPQLLQCPAAVRFVSVEPMLSAVDISPYLLYNPVNGGGDYGEVQKQREDSLSGRDRRGVKNRPTGTDMESCRKKGQPVEWQNQLDPVQATPGRAQCGAISSDSGNVQQETNQCPGAQIGLPSFQRPNTRRLDNQSHQRDQEGQSLGEFGGYNVLRTNDSFYPSSQNWCGSKAVGRKQSQKEIDNGTGRGNTQATIGRRDLDRDSSRLSREFSNGIQNCTRGAALSWVICGGESGPGARPMDVAWARSLRDQCQAAGVLFFFKQWGAWIPIEQWNATCLEKLSVANSGRVYHWPDDSDSLRVGKRAAGRLLDGQEYNEMPRRKA